MAYEIQKGIPVPVGRQGGLTETLQKLEVGESFLMPIAKRTSIASYSMRFSPKKFATRAEGKDSVRVWRTA